MSIQVKICGIRTAHSAKVAVESGADFLGFNFIPNEKRYIHPLKAKKIIMEFKQSIHCVGVFQNNDIVYVNSIIKDTHITFVQLHGNESIDYAKRIDAKIIKAIQGINEFSYPSDYILVDREKYPSLLSKKNKKSLLLAGGLNKKNVFMFIKKYAPIGVDVARGIETNGHEDIKKINEFIVEAKRRLA